MVTRCGQTDKYTHTYKSNTRTHTDTHIHRHTGILPNKNTNELNLWWFCIRVMCMWVVYVFACVCVCVCMSLDESSGLCYLPNATKYKQHTLCPSMCNISCRFDAQTSLGREFSCVGLCQWTTIWPKQFSLPMPCPQLYGFHRGLDTPSGCVCVRGVATVRKLKLH